MPLQFLHRMYKPQTYPYEAATAAPDVLATWLRYSPDALPAERDFEKWAENAIMLHEADRISPNNVRLLPRRPGTLISGDRAGYVPSKPGAPRAFMYGIWQASDSQKFPTDVDMVGNHAAALRTILGHANSPVFIKAAGRVIYPVDADTEKAEAALLQLHHAGHRTVFMKTRFKQSAGLYVLPDEPERLWATSTRDSDLEWFMIQHEGERNALYIQEAFEPTKEYRMIIVGDTVATGAGCIERFTPLDNRGDAFDPRVEVKRNDGDIVHDPDTVIGYYQFAQQFASEWAAENGSELIYSLDLATNARTGKTVVIELNPMMNLGLYACDARRILSFIQAHFEA